MACNSSDDMDTVSLWRTKWQSGCIRWLEGAIDTSCSVRACYDF